MMTGARGATLPDHEDHRLATAHGPRVRQYPGQAARFRDARAAEHFIARFYPDAIGSRGAAAVSWCSRFRLNRHRLNARYHVLARSEAGKTDLTGVHVRGYAILMKEGQYVRTKLLALILLVGGSLYGQVSIGIRIGPPPRPRVVRVVQSPGPGFVWVGGYWYADGSRYRWHNGYWTRPPYQGARWIEPRHDGERFFVGYWDGDHGRFDHDHRWDRDRNHDYREREDRRDRH